MKPNADITLYKIEDGKYIRQAITGVYWFAVQQSNVNKSGLTNADRISIHIPISSAESLEIATNKDLVVKGISELEFDNTDQRTQSESLRELKALHEVFTITAFDPKLYGSKRLQHYELSCK